MLGACDWMGDGYRSRFRTAEEVDAFLRGVPVRYVLADTSVPQDQIRQHHRLLLEAMDRSADWERVASFDRTEEAVTYPGALRLYRLRAGAEGPSGAGGRAFTFGIDPLKRVGG